MIEPTTKDVGTRRVIYKSSWCVDKPEYWEYGFITGFNDFFVFVKYGTDTGSKATKRENLYWDVT